MTDRPRLRKIAPGFAEVWSASGLIHYGYVRVYPAPAPPGGCAWHAETITLTRTGKIRMRGNRNVCTSTMCGSRTAATNHVARIGQQIRAALASR